MHDIAMQNICITLHNLFGFLAFFIAVQFPRGSVLVTEVDRYLANYVIKSFSSNDWLSCTLACQDDTTCVSYNYDMNTGFCELNNEGIQTQFVQTDLLFTKRGVVFHQIRVRLYTSFVFLQHSQRKLQLVSASNFIVHVMLY